MAGMSGAGRTSVLHEFRYRGRFTSDTAYDGRQLRHVPGKAGGAPSLCPELVRGVL